MGCKIGSFPSTYLGLPLGVKFRSTEIWNGIIEKFEKKLASWQMQYLSFGGRLTLINSVLDSIPTYYMSLFPIPAKVLKQLDKLRRNFLWEGNNERHKFHLIKWKKVTQPKTQGGLGIKDLAAHNKSMMMKWLWRYNMEDSGFWKVVIKAKHGEPGVQKSQVLHTVWDYGKASANYGVLLLRTSTLKLGMVHTSDSGRINGLETLPSKLHSLTCSPLPKILMRLLLHIGKGSIGT